jgi:hypothetical protein
VCDEKGQIFKFKNRRSQEVSSTRSLPKFRRKRSAHRTADPEGGRLDHDQNRAEIYSPPDVPPPHAGGYGVGAKDKSELIGRILNTAYNRSPWWLVPRRMPKRAPSTTDQSFPFSRECRPPVWRRDGPPQCDPYFRIGRIPNPKVTIEEGLSAARRTPPEPVHGARRNGRRQHWVGWRISGAIPKKAGR